MTSNCLAKWKELETPKQTMKIYSLNIVMEFGIEKCAVLIMRSGKRKIMEGIELPNQEKNRKLGEKATYKYMKEGTLKQVKMKEKI